MNITIKINTDNDAFREDAMGEVAGVLRGLALRAEDGMLDDHPEILDINGNSCGTVSISD